LLGLLIRLAGLATEALRQCYCRRERPTSPGRRCGRRWRGFSSRRHLSPLSPLSHWRKGLSTPHRPVDKFPHGRIALATLQCHQASKIVTDALPTLQTGRVAPSLKSIHSCISKLFDRTINPPRRPPDEACRPAVGEPPIIRCGAPFISRSRSIA